MHEENFELIWALIIENAGNPFHTPNGTEFIYEIIGERIQIVRNRPYNLLMQNFLNALPHFDPGNQGAIPQRIGGRPYIWGIYNGLEDQIDQF
jgi:hypothetical protein